MTTSAEEVLEEVIANHRGDRDAAGINLLEDLKRLYLRQSPDGRAAVGEALSRWVEGNEPKRAGWGIDLIRDLGLVEYLEVLERTREGIRSGTSTLPDYYLSWLDPAIDALKMATRKE